jgi:hypothetical protein
MIFPSGPARWHAVLWRLVSDVLPCVLTLAWGSESG